MSPDTLPTWLTVPLVILASLTALYRCYILPGYRKDKENDLVR